MQMSCAYPCSFGGRAVDYLEMKNEFTTEQNDRKTGAEEVGKKRDRRMLERQREGNRGS